MEGTLNDGPDGPAYHTIKIQRLALEGDGVGRIVSGDALQGKVAFVPYTLPDETVAAQPREEKKTYLRCVPRQLLESSPDRITPACPYHFSDQKTGLWCGGCNWQHMKAETQRAWKKALVRETLQRLGHVPECPDIDLLHTNETWRYRNTAQFVFDRCDGDLVAGYFAPASHDTISIEDCLIQSPIALRILTTVRRILPELGLQPFERKSGRGWLKHLLIRSNEQREALIALITGDVRFPERERFIRSVTEKCPEITGIFQNIQPSRTSIVTGKQWIHLWGAHLLKERFCGLTLATSPGSFLQVNTGAAQLLYERTLREAQLQPGMTVLDLYCGTGALTLMAAATAGRVIGVDALDSAIEDARANARFNGIDRITFHAITAERFLRRAREQKLPTGDRLVVFVDPPRAGCQPAVIERLLLLAPLRIIYLSCNPATLARDIHLLSANYQFGSLTAVDLFPHTSHIEAIARLERKALR